MFTWLKKFFKRFFGLDYNEPKKIITEPTDVTHNPVRPAVEGKGEILLGRGNDGPSHGGSGHPEGKGEIDRPDSKHQRPDPADKGNDENLFKNKKKKVLMGRGNDGPSSGGSGHPTGKGEIDRPDKTRSHVSDGKIKGNDDNLFKNKKKKK